MGPVGNVTITGGINGYVLSTNGSGLLSWVAQSGGGGGGSNISNGTSNVNIATVNGNVTTSVGGNANIVVVTSTGANITGTLSATGNVTGDFFIGNGSQLTGITVGAGTSILNGTSNVNVLLNGNVTTTVAGNTTVTVTGTGANISGTLSANGNITGGNLIGIFANGNSNVTISSSGGNIQFGVTGNANVLSVTKNGAEINGSLYATSFAQLGSVFTSFVNTPVINGQVDQELRLSSYNNGANPTLSLSSINQTSGNATTRINVDPSQIFLRTNMSGSQYAWKFDDTGNLILPGNTFSVNYANGTQVSLGGGGGGSNISNGTSNVNIATSGGNVTTSVAGNANIVVVTGTGANVNGTLSVSGTSNLGPVGNVTITGGVNGYVLSTDGSGVLSWVAQTGGGGGGSNISNGTSNVNIATSGGNVTTSVGGNANIVVVTGTGANIAGTLSASGNVTGNFFIGNGSQLTGITVSAGTSITNGTSNVNVILDGNVTTVVGGTTRLSVNTDGANVTGNLSAGNVIADSSLRVGSNIAMLSNIARYTYVSNIAPTSGDGNVGDIWYQTV